jgi:hypothetical protein
MRGLHGVLISLALICFLIIPSVALSTEWVLYTKSQFGSYYYDKKGIISTQYKTKEVWVKIIYSKIGRRMAIKGRMARNLTTADWENLSHGINQHRLNCTKREWGLVSRADYDLNGKVLHSTVFKKVKWRSIEPDSGEMVLFKKVCVKQKKK